MGRKYLAKEKAQGVEADEDGAAFVEDDGEPEGDDA